jgi:hypothetical protein
MAKARTVSVTRVITHAASHPAWLSWSRRRRAIMILEWAEAYVVFTKRG